MGKTVKGTFRPRDPLTLLSSQKSESLSEPKIEHWDQKNFWIHRTLEFAFYQLLSVWWRADGTSGKEPACQCPCRRYKRCGLVPGSGRSPGEGNGNPLQYSCLENLWTEEPGRLQSLGSHSQTWLKWQYATMHAWWRAGLRVSEVALPVLQGGVWNPSHSSLSHPLWWEPVGSMY